ncbi:uncharacterized protein LOC134538769 [Bacillus rossius redtenbacheri]|uniref:uncharacterized protein LOC134538769 n=1 Tax=Bacillus rossius redtenbacheri TaxID=93214 RepID=UPI002FDCE027
MNVFKKRKGNTNCCVVGCSNAYRNTSPDIVFYSFPKRKTEEQRRKLWVQAVRRQNVDNSPWEPTTTSRICSVHFIGNKRSGHPKNPAFVPSLFPKNYKKTAASSQASERYERSAKRLKKSSYVDIIDYECSTSAAIKKHEVAIQTDVNETIVCDFVFSCTTDGDELSTQASIPLQVCLNSYKKRYDKSSGTSDMCNEIQGFQGYPSISDETELRDLTGVTFAVFNLLLTLLLNQTQSYSKISKENRLLIFLMKMKTGLSYSAMRVMFGVHRTTISRIFTTTLMLLASTMANYVFWPSRESIMETMPAIFKRKYPNCRVIIDCTEIKVEQPPIVDQRIFLYSNYKGTYTIKFLVGISPSGMVTFKSKCYGGRSSDTFITNDCGLLILLEVGDEVMADKGFPGIKTSLSDKGVVVVTPPYLHDGKLTAEEVETTYSIASVRIHVERCIQRIKIFHILDKLSIELLPFIDDIVHMCCVLVNLQSPIIKNNT